MGVTERLIDFALQAEVPPDALDVMRLCLFDWGICALGGARAPVANVVRALVSAEAGTSQSSVVGLLSMAVPARAAALANGAISHALDYDDTHFAHIGHPSVVIVPAALAVAERETLEAAAFLRAAIVGAEASVRLGQWLGEGHAAAGFHTTATAGAYGAALAVGRLLDLDARIMAHMLGGLATRTAGLTCQFGSMGKPMNAGFAASAAVEAAELASAGLEAPLDALEGMIGFGAAHRGDAWAPAFVGLGSEWRMMGISHKSHACCHGLHAMLEALAGVRLTPQAIDRVTVRVHPRWAAVCNIWEPSTGLEAKFSYRLTAAMALAGRDTSAPEHFTDAVCRDSEIVGLRDKTDVLFDAALTPTMAHVDIVAHGGRAHALRHDLATPVALAERRTRLELKARAVLGAQVAECLAEATLGASPDIAALARLMRQAG